jgi:hypothetical protein
MPSGLPESQIVFFRYRSPQAKAKPRLSIEPRLCCIPVWAARLFHDHRPVGAAAVLSVEAETARALAINYRLIRNTPIRLGILSTIGHTWFSRLLAGFQRQFDSVEVTVQEGRNVDISRRLRDGELDLAVLNPLENGADFTLAHLYSERYVGAGHPLPTSNTVTA